MSSLEATLANPLVTHFLGLAIGLFTSFFHGGCPNATFLVAPFMQSPCIRMRHFGVLKRESPSMYPAASIARQARAMITVVSLALGCGMVSAQIGLEKPAASAAATGPSLEETTKWLTEKINGVGYNRVQLRDAYRPHAVTSDTVNFLAEFQGCKFRFIERFGTQGQQVSRPDDAILTGELTQLNASDVQIVDFVEARDEVGNNPGFSRLLVWTVGKQSSLPWQRPLARDAFPDRTKPFVILYFRGREMAERAQNAMQHAIKLCVQQAGQRKAAEPPRPKEIF